MLWYKAWLETRSRFLISLVGVAALCSLIVYHGDKIGLSHIKDDYYYHVLGSGHAMLVLMWILVVTLSVMGGLLRERAAGSSAFTLSLPVSRRRLMVVRIVTVLIQAIALAVVPWLAMFSIGSIFGQTHSVSQAAFYVFLLLAGGLLFLSIAVLASSLIEGEYTAPIVSLGAVIAISIAMDNPYVHRRSALMSPFQFMIGNPYLDRPTFLLTGPLPWLQATKYILVALLLLVISVEVIRRQEF
jgi:ABC-type transport system involved in multi-copper enzyme maturation permease subunit